MAIQPAVEIDIDDFLVRLVEDFVAVVGIELRLNVLNAGILQ